MQFLIMKEILFLYFVYNFSKQIDIKQRKTK